MDVTSARGSSRTISGHETTPESLASSAPSTKNLSRDIPLHLNPLYNSRNSTTSNTTITHTMSAEDDSSDSESGGSSLLGSYNNVQRESIADSGGINVRHVLQDKKNKADYCSSLATSATLSDSKPNSTTPDINVDINMTSGNGKQPPKINVRISLTDIQLK